MRFSALFVILSLALAACADRASFHVIPEAKEVGTLHEIFVVTNRGQRAEDGAFDESRSSVTTYAISDVSVPPSHVVGQTKTNPRNPDPRRDFVIAEHEAFASTAGFKRQLRRSLAEHAPEDRDVTLFVHGYNTSYSEGLFRLAQVTHDLEPPGETVLFSWPSAAQIVGYANDHDSMIFSRDALQETLYTLNDVAPKRTLLVAHSMGAMLTMETLRQIEIERPGWSRRHLHGVVLISPDIDIDVFRSQLARIPNLPQPFVVFVSQNDRALEISGLVNGRPQRLGRDSDIEQLRDYPILVIDVSQFSDGRNADHFTVGSSAELMEFLSNPELEREINMQVFGTDELRASGQLVGATAKRAEKAVQWILFPNSRSN